MPRSPATTPRILRRALGCLLRRPVPAISPPLLLVLLLLVVAGVGCGHSSRRPGTAEPPLPSSRLANIASKTADGTVIVLADRSTWIVRADDRDVARQWRVPDLVEARAGSDQAAATGASRAFPEILANRETGDSIRVRRDKDFGG